MAYIQFNPPGGVQARSRNIIDFLKLIIYNATNVFHWEVNMNCWEFKKCGREQGGVNAVELGVCPAWPDKGQKCARVAGTLCGGQVQGTFATKLGNCMSCDFYLSEDYDKSYLNAG